ncbi:zinc finger protein 846-like [Danaus plexippus]|uniref:zinc finger protein 846-like n=1 Tax=Danaus plexippus TaxID=13037 RepID=UPI002AB12C0F|nr:zinc finger protein 846-like [Danaus plexippus]
MSNVLCFVCYGTVHSDISDGTRAKYRDFVGISLCPESQLCYVCCHILNKMCIFKSLCLKRSTDYPIFSEKDILRLHITEVKTQTICDDECCERLKVDIKNYNDNYDENLCGNNKDIGSDEDINGYGTDDDNNGDINYYEYNISDAYHGNEDGKQNGGHTEVGLKEDVVLEDTLNNDVNEDDRNDSNDDNDDNDDRNHDVINKDDVKVTDGRKMRKNRLKKSKRRGLMKITLTVEEQRAELEAKRKEKKYTEAEFKCYNCAIGFLFKDTYQAHMMRHEESNGQYSCPICTLRVSSLTLLRVHASRHAERSVCVRCGVRVPGRHHVCKHTRTRSLPCHMCARLFTDASGLQQHLKRVHTSKTSGRLHTCTVCGETYNTQAALRTHMIKHIKRKFPCELCPSVYSSPYTLNQHMKTHNQVSETYYCETCNVSFTSRKGLMAHRRNTLKHQQTLFECPICGRVCPNQRALASHIQAVHSSSKEYSCSMCSSSYTSRKSLVRHVGTHRNSTGGPLAVCHLCGNCFKGNNKLNRHLRDVCEKAKAEEATNSYE